MKTIDEIVRRALVQRQYPIHWYLQFYSYAISGYQGLHFDVLNNVKTIKRAMDSKNMVKLPDDYIDYYKIGIQSGDKIRPLGQNQHIANNETYIEDSAFELTTTYAPYFRNYYNPHGEFEGRLYGYQPVYSDSFKVFDGRIRFDASIAQQDIYIEYLTKAYSPGVATVVHPYAERALILFIIWQYVQNTRHFGIGERREAERQYYNEERKVRGRINSLSMTDILRSWRSGHKLSVKG